MAIMTNEQMADHLSEGKTCCPVCRTSVPYNLVFDQLDEIGGGVVEQPAGCAECSARWTLVYTFTEVRDLQSEDSALDPEQLAIKYADPDGAGWGEHPTWPRSDWQREVSEGDTLQGYWAWVQSMIESALEDQE